MQNLNELAKNIKSMDIEALGKAKVQVSKLRNKDYLETAEQESVNVLISAIAKRESRLEREFQKSCKNNKIEFIRCESCGKRKPAVDGYFGFGLTRSGNWKSECKACYRETSRNYHADHLESGRERAMKHQYKRLNEVEGNITNTEKNALRIKQNNTCAYCGTDLGGGGELDHYIPVEFGGTNDLSNRVWCCRQCNRDKGRKLPDDFLHQRLRDALPIRKEGFFKPVSHRG